MRAYDIIEQKRLGYELTHEQLKFFIDGFVAGDIPDYQASAWLMAVCCRGMTGREISDLTSIMAESGDTVDLSRFGEKTVDKHSTGGVGDKTSLIIAPIVACLGGKVAKMSGRGLGYTGGTIDKLESIPGYRTVMSPDEFMDTVSRAGMAVISQSGNIAPADKKLYALRDVTATVESIPLITSSIMSKKIAAGAKSIVLDVKTGSGAFMKTRHDAAVLAENMVDIGKRLGRRVSALITNMDVPLGSAVGNSLEVIEAVSVLKGETQGELYSICIALAAEMVSLALQIGSEEAEKLAAEAISTGRAFEKMCEWVECQGGNAAYLTNTSLFRTAGYSFKVKALKDGYISAVNTAELGNASVCLGAGRIKKEDKINPAAGIIIHRKTGEFVKRGDTLCTLYSDSCESFEEANNRISRAVALSESPPETKPLVFEIIK